MPDVNHARYNPVLLCAFHALHMSLFPVSVLTFFFRDEIELSMTSILGVQAIFGLVIAALEFPSGYVADRMGYRRALSLGSALALVGWAVYAAARSLAGIVWAEVFLGAGFSLISGADAALLYESLRASGRQAEFGKWYGRMRSAGQVAEGSAALVAGSLYARWTRLPFVLEIFVFAGALLIARLLMEAPVVRARGLPHGERMFRVVRHAFLDNRRLRAVIYLTTVLGLASYVPVWLVPLYAREVGISPETWGLVWAGSSYTVALASLAGSSLRKRWGLSVSLFSCIALVSTGYLGLGLSHGVFGVAYYFCLTWVRGVQSTLLHHEEQTLIATGDRASFVSLRSLVFRLSFVLLGPLVGSAVEQHGQRAVYLCLGVVLTLAAIHAWWSLERVKASTVGLPHACTPASGRPNLPR